MTDIAPNQDTEILENAPLRLRNLTEWLSSLHKEAPGCDADGLVRIDLNKTATAIEQMLEENRALKESYAETLEDLLLSGSHDAEKHKGWLCHSFMTDQEHSLSQLVKLGLYELHPNNDSICRKVI